MSKVMIIAAHPDDEVLGAGGTASKLARAGDEVIALILGEGVASRYNKKTKQAKKEIVLLRKLSEKSAKVIGYKKVLFEDLPDNRFDSLDFLEVVKIVEGHINRVKPDIIYTHFYGDLNIDHIITNKVVVTATRPADDYCVKELFCFETLSSTEWNFGQREAIFNPNVFIDIEDTLELKLEAMKCYESELKDYPHPRSIESLKINAAQWGTVVGKKYVEPFELVRKVVD